MILYREKTVLTQPSNKEQPVDINKQNDQYALTQAILEALPIIRRSIGGHLPDDPKIKDDKTLVTVTDAQVQDHLLPILHREFPNVRIISEEGAEIGEGETVIFLDPLDGTRAFSCGLATSTIIAGVYDSAKKEVTGCVVGEASHGRTWEAFGDSQTRSRIYTSDHFFYEMRRVWPKSMDEQSTIFLDVPHGFTKKDKAGKQRQIFTDEEIARLFYVLRGKKLAIPGSNGLIQALVANGGQKVVGSITTAIGGPWDVCGVKLVLNAGGCARAFSMFDDGFYRHIGKEKDPLDVMDYDILVCGNRQATVDRLSQALAEACPNEAIRELRSAESERR